MNTWTCGPKALGLERWSGDDRVAAVFNFDEQTRTICTRLALGSWNVILDSSDSCWFGTGSAIPRLLRAARESVNLTMPPLSFVLLRRTKEESPIGRAS